MKTKPFALEINLDDEQEANSFINKHCIIRGRALANRLGLKGKGSAKLASALSNYAWNKVTAILCRSNGEIKRARTYEDLCDRIYRDDINPVCACW